MITVNSEVVSICEIFLHEARPLLADLADFLVTVGVKHLKVHRSVI